MAPLYGIWQSLSRFAQTGLVGARLHGVPDGWVGYTVDTYLRARYRRRVRLEVWTALLRVPLELGLGHVLVDDLTDEQAAALAQAYRAAAERQQQRRVWGEVTGLLRRAPPARRRR